MSSVSIRLRTTLSLVAALTLALFLFQNCEFSVAPGVGLAKSVSAPLESRGGNGNGNGYDGKTYSYVVAGQNCSDGNPVASTIEFRGSDAYLTRDNCVDIPVGAQTVVKVDFDLTNSSVVYYLGRAYRDAITRFGGFVSSASGERYLNATAFKIDGTKFPNGELSAYVISRYDTNGKSLWSVQAIADSTHSTSVGIATARNDGGFDALGSYMPATGLGPIHSLLVNVGADGVERSATAFTGPTDRDFISAHSLLPVSDGYFYSGSVSLMSGNFEDVAFFSKLSPTGQVVWQKTYRGPHNSFDDVLTVVPAKDGDLYLSGAANGVRTVMKVKTDGSLVWSRSLPDMTYGLISFNSISFFPALDGGVYVAGGAGNFDGLTKLSSAGTIVWTRTLAAQDSAATHFYGMTENPDGSIFIVGQARHKDASVLGLLAQVQPDGSLGWLYEYSSSPRDQFDGNPIDLGTVFWIPGLTQMPSNAKYMTGFVATIPKNIGTNGCFLCAKRSDYFSIPVTIAITAGPVFTDDPAIQSTAMPDPFELRKVPLYFELPKQ